MRGKIDENMPTEAADLLRQAGWECDTVYDEALAGAEDPRLIDRCRAEGRVLFTTDLDFADIRAYPPSEQVGVVVFRALKPSRAAVPRACPGSDSRAGVAMGRTPALDRRARPRSSSERRGIGCLTARWSRRRDQTLARRGSSRDVLPHEHEIET